MAVLLGGTALSAPAWAVNVSNESELRTAIFAANGGGDSNINITGNITLTQSLPMITASVTVTGNGNTIDANNTGRVFFVQSGTASISNVTVNNARAVGGAGGAGGGSSGGGGGGLGAGAAVFVNSAATVTLTNVSVGNASAAGGAGGGRASGSSGGGGGGGGLGGAGGADLQTLGGSGAGGGGYAGTGGNAGNNAGGGGGGEFGGGGTGGSNGGGGGGGGQQGGGGTSTGTGQTGGGAGGGGATASGGNGNDVGAAGTGGGAQGGNGGTGNGSGASGSNGAALGGGGGGGADNPSPGGNGGNGGLSGGGGGGALNSTVGGVGGIGGGGGGGGTGTGTGSGGAGGDFGGGGGAGVQFGTAAGGTGGFGGGGGGARALAAAGGDGGFGGGGGSGGSAGGAGGTLGGHGATNANTGSGGGGGAAGGAFFVRDGGTLTINGGNLAGTYNVTGGAAGGGNATAGQAQGTVMYLHGTGTNAMNIASGTQTLAGNNAVAGSGGLTKSGAGTLSLTGANANYSGTTSVTAGIVAISASNSLGTGSVSLNGGILQFDAAMTMSQGVTLGASNGTVDTNGNVVTMSGVLTGTGSLTKTGSNLLVLDGANNYGGGTTVSAGTLQGTTTSLQGSITNNAAVTFAQIADGVYAGAMSGSGSLTKSGTGRVTLTGANTYGGGTDVRGGTLQLGAGGSLSTAGALTISNNAIFDVNGRTQTVGALSATSGSITLGGGALTAGDASSTTVAANITGAGSFIKQGAGTMTLTGTNNYSSGTTISAGTLQGNTTSLQGAIANNAALVFDQTIDGTYAGSMTGTGTFTKQGAGLLNLTGTSTVGGGTTVSAGTLAVNGNLTSNVTVGGGGTLGGSGTITGLVTNNGTIAPGNSIGTINITGNYVQAAGSIYQVEVNAAGQSDRIVATGTATINGGTVQVIAEQGTYARNTTYTILTAAGGVTGAYSNVTSNFAFLRPTLSYDASNVFLTLIQTTSAFASGAQTPNQFAVGTALDLANPTATGDFNNVLNAIASLNTVQGPAALNAISGQNYSGFSSGLVQTAQLFMSNFTGKAGSAAGGGAKIALAEACTVACDTTEPAKWGVWGGAIGATGSIGGNANAGTTTYNAGGFAAGIDRQVTPELLLGVTVGYASGNQWVSGFSGRGWSGTVQAGLYASYAKGPIYFDALAGYAYTDNQMVRQIVIPGLNARSAQGNTGANQFFGQLEGGYRFDIGGAPQAYVTPFVRLQASTATQNAFTESGADSLNLSVAQQTTNSLRSVLGAQIGGAINSFAAQLKLGWSHEFASTDRPVSASFVGAPAIPFTTYGAAPNRDGVVLGFNATQAIDERSEVFFRYEGDISGSDNTHAGTLGVRFTW